MCPIFLFSVSNIPTVFAYAVFFQWIVLYLIVSIADRLVIMAVKRAGKNKKPAK